MGFAVVVVFFFFVVVLTATREIPVAVGTLVLGGFFSSSSDIKRGNSCCAMYSSSSFSSSSDRNRGNSCCAMYSSSSWVFLVVVTATGKIHIAPCTLVLVVGFLFVFFLGGGGGVGSSDRNRGNSCCAMYSSSFFLTVLTATGEIPVAVGNLALNFEHPSLIWIKGFT